MGGCFSKDARLVSAPRSSPYKTDPVARTSPSRSQLVASDIGSGSSADAVRTGHDTTGASCQEPLQLASAAAQAAKALPIANGASDPHVDPQHMEPTGSPHSYAPSMHAARSAGAGLQCVPSNNSPAALQPGPSLAAGMGGLSSSFQTPDTSMHVDPADPMLQPINPAAKPTAQRKVAPIRTVSGNCLSSDSSSSDSASPSTVRHNSQGGGAAQPHTRTGPQGNGEIRPCNVMQEAQQPAPSNHQAQQEGSMAGAAPAARIQRPISPFTIVAAAAAAAPLPPKPPPNPFAAMAAASSGTQSPVNGTRPNSSTAFIFPAPIRPRTSTPVNPFASAISQQGAGFSASSPNQPASEGGTTSRPVSGHTGSPMPPRRPGSAVLGAAPSLSIQPSELSCCSSAPTSLPLISGEGFGLHSVVGHEAGSTGDGGPGTSNSATHVLGDMAQQGKQGQGGNDAGLQALGGGGMGQGGDETSAEGSGGRTTGGTALPDAMVLRASLPQELAERPATLELRRINKEIKGLKWLGQGAGGVVYKGFWHDVPVAIKFMLSSNPDHLNEKYREAILARFVSHPNVVQTYTYDRAYINDTIVKHARTNALGGPRPASGESINKSLNLFDQVDGTASALSELMGRSLTGTQNLTNSLGLAGSLGANTSPSQAVTVPGWGTSSDGPSASGHPAHAAGGQAGMTGFDARRVLSGGSNMPSMEGSGFGDPEGSLATAGGWSLGDVLVHMGAQQGQYLTHIIMELCDAGTLLKAIKTGAFVEEKTAKGSQYHLRAVLRTAREVARGVAFLHSLNIIHGDLKPGNVLLRSSTEDKRGFVAKVADFGLARIQPQDELHKVEELQGTPVYLAPEVVKDGAISKSADVYALGMLLWQMVTGQQPFAGMRPAQIMYGKQQGTLALAWPSNVYSPLRKLGELCLDPDPRARPTAEQINKALLKIEQHLHKKMRGAAASSHSAGAFVATSGPSTGSTAAITASAHVSAGPNSGAGVGGGASRLSTLNARAHALVAGEDVATQVGVLPRVLEQSGSSLSQSGCLSSESVVS